MNEHGDLYIFNCLILVNNLSPLNWEIKKNPSRGKDDKAKMRAQSPLLEDAKERLEVRFESTSCKVA